jgi:hypothetical protein
MNSPIRRLLSVNWLLTEHTLNVLVDMQELTDIKIVSGSLPPPPPQRIYNLTINFPTTLSYKRGATGSFPGDKAA